MNYTDFVTRKLTTMAPTGIIGAINLPDGLFDFQQHLTSWCLRRGRAALFADTGLGKSRMEATWASRVNAVVDYVLMLAPLAVAAQTVREAAKIGVIVRHVRSGSEITGPGIYITNYDRLHLFDAGMFGGVVLDESSCIKHHGSSTFNALCTAFAHCSYRLAATATPAPNDWTELGTHAEFLGVCTRQEMLSEYFVHDGGETQTWRLKGHARAQFWRWVATWAALVRKPSDLGFDDTRYILPPLITHQHVIAAPADAAERIGQLFAMEAQTLSERRTARRASIDQRVSECAALVNSDSEQWLVWCDLNDESAMLTKAIAGAVEVKGADDSDHKERSLLAFADGQIRALVSKPSIAGWGCNFQSCARIAFVGVTDSFEAFYQAVRRCWRFGQLREVHVHIFSSELEGAVVANIKRKSADADEMADALAAETRAQVMAEATGQTRTTNTYAANAAVLAPSWLKTEAA